MFKQEVSGSFIWCLCPYISCLVRWHSMLPQVTSKCMLKIYLYQASKIQQSANRVPLNALYDHLWDHVRSLLESISSLQTLTSTFPGHWALTIHVSIWISFSTPLGVCSRSHATWRHGLQICPQRYPFAPGSREAVQHEVPSSWLSGSVETGIIQPYWI